MDLVTVKSYEERKDADVLVVPFWNRRDECAEYASFQGDAIAFMAPVKTGDFSGSVEETTLVYLDKQQEPRALMVGLGEKEKISVEMLRRSYAQVARMCRVKKFSRVNLLVPAIEGLVISDVARGMAEGLFLGDYMFSGMKASSEETPLEVVTFVAANEVFGTSVVKAKMICDAVDFARDLVNGNADTVTPQYLASVAIDLGKTFKKVTTTVFDKKDLEKAGMGLLLAVGRGADKDPSFMTMEYRGNPDSEQKIALVGKGITYDSGGLNLKIGTLQNMRDDMGGAAVVLATIQAAAQLKLPVNIVGVIAAAENSISSTSYKCGDVYKGYAGKSVEVGNTDAEGRLILADALAYACKVIKPTHIVDIATLTGAMTIALGEEAAGLMANNDALALKLISAGESTYERLWRLPMYDEYRQNLDSDIADIKNMAGKSAGSIHAAIFLKEFVEDVPWAHIDIAATVFYDKQRRYHPKNATGWGVRLMIEFLEHV